MKYSRHTNQRAFTLIEIIVSLGIFAIVATVALGALVKIVSANKKAQTVQAAVTNINYALDAISREMRVGRNYYCVFGPSFNTGTLSDGDYTSNTKCPTGYTNRSDNVTIAFNSTRSGTTGLNEPCNLITAYQFVYVSSSKYTLTKAEQQSCDNPTVYTFTSILDPTVVITGYFVKVVADAATPFPRATIRISGYAGVAEKDKTYFDVQTTVSARIQ